MIDYVSLRTNITIPINYFSSVKWKRSKTEDGQYFRWHTVRGVKLRYYEETQCFTINGKILMYLYDTQVQNLDDIYGSQKELFIDEINCAINKLFPSPILDIRDFTVTRIDYCFNVDTPYVPEYIEFLGHAFQMTNSGSRVDYVRENGLYGSVYVRTASDYRENQNKNYTLNFYDKSDRLRYLQNKGCHVSEADKILANNVLRLEVQCGYQMIKRQAKKYGISNTFGNLLDYRIAYDTISHVYSLVFKGTENTDFFTYPMAKEKLKGNPKAQAVIRTAASHRIMKPEYTYGRNLAKQMGVYPHCFLPREGKLTQLNNPMKLLKNKLNTLGVL